MGIRGPPGGESAPVDTPRTTPGSRPDPARVRSDALAGAWVASAAYGVVLAGIAVGAPGWTGGDLRAALLPGVPGAIVLALFLIGRAPARRRVTMALTTTVAGFLALTTASSLGALDADAGGAVLFQVGCFVASVVFLTLTVPAWRRVNAEGDRADDLLRMYDEL